jgi:hypothetical protein
MRQAADADDHGTTAEAKRWLHEYLVLAGGEAWSADVKKEARGEHSDSALARARQALKVNIVYRARFPNQPQHTVWCLPELSDDPAPRGEGIDNIFKTHGETGQEGSVPDISDISSVGDPSRARETVEWDNLPIGIPPDILGAP